METNKIHNKDFLKNTLPNECADLIISDPPYYKTRGDFDFGFKNFALYLQSVENWVLECKRILKPHGTLFWYADTIKAAHTQVIMDKHLYITNHITWLKPNAYNVAQDPHNLRIFTPLTETILMYTKTRENESPKASIFPEELEHVRQYLRLEISKVGTRKAAEHLNVSTRAIGHWISHSQWHFPSYENIEKLQQLGIFTDKEKIKSLKNEVVNHYKNTNKSRRTFNNIFELSNVIKETIASGDTKTYEHPTTKPEKLTSKLILTTTNCADFVVVPFAGSGTECAMAAKLQRRFIGYEINKHYAINANKRAAEHLKQTAIAI